jgi:hypothetical protein
VFFPLFLEETKQLVWEVNFWSWLETVQHWKPIWYPADHNDSILRIPSRYFSRCLFDSLNSILEYNYPTIEHFLPDSASYIVYQGKRILNTRYINYEIQPTGCYLYKGSGAIENINIVSELDEDLHPIYYQYMRENIGLPSNENAFSKGLEDIRLFEYDTQLCFIATNVNYSPIGKNRMIVGKYDIHRNGYSDCRVIEPPSPTSCEKNWIPIVSKDNELCFIYKWYPLEIGKINIETNTLEITNKILYVSPLFEKVRGSSTFVADPDQDGHLVGVVHYSEETQPRTYFHMLVLLDKDTWKPLKHTEVFYFEKPNIEFCIGFGIVDHEYKFWISRMDIDPLLISIHKNKVPFSFDFM